MSPRLINTRREHFTYVIFRFNTQSLKVEGRCRITLAASSIVRSSFGLEVELDISISTMLQTFL